MLDKNLKNFDYDSFIEYVNKMATSRDNILNKAVNKKTKYKLFGFINLLVAKKKNNKTIYRLFGFLPVLTIKEK